jgi:hypothetical protein
MALPFGSGFSPLLGEPRMGMVPIPNILPTSITLTTGGGVVTGTAAQLLNGFLILNTTNAQTYTLPTAALLNAAIPAVVNGCGFAVDFVNVGASTCTIAVGTGGTLVVGNSKSTVATVATVTSLRLLILITGVLKNGDSSDSYTVIGMGNVAAAVA